MRSGGMSVKLAPECAARHFWPLVRPRSALCRAVGLAIVLDDFTIAGRNPAFTEVTALEDHPPVQTLIALSNLTQTRDRHDESPFGIALSIGLLIFADTRGIPVDDS